MGGIRSPASKLCWVLFILNMLIFFPLLLTLCLVATWKPFCSSALWPSLPGPLTPRFVAQPLAGSAWQTVARYVHQSGECWSVICNQHSCASRNPYYGLRHTSKSALLQDDVYFFFFSWVLQQALSAEVEFSESNLQLEYEAFARV